jgi:hypothetical protein
MRHAYNPQLVTVLKFLNAVTISFIPSDLIESPARAATAAKVRLF